MDSVGHIGRGSKSEYIGRCKTGDKINDKKEERCLSTGLYTESAQIQSTRTVLGAKGRTGDRDDQSKGTIRLQVKG